MFFPFSNDFRNGQRWVGNSNVDYCKSPQSLLNESRINLQEFVDYVEVQNSLVDIIKIFPTDSSFWQPKMDRNSGFCYTFKTSELKDKKPMQIVFYFKQKSILYIHSPGSFTGRTRIKLTHEYNETDKTLQLDYDVFKTLNDWKGPCNPDESYKKDDCFEALIMKESMETLNCTWPFLDNKAHICTDLNKTKEAFKIGSKYYKTTDSRCPRPCTFVKVLYVTKEKKSNKKFIKIKYPLSIKVIQSYYIYDFLSLFAEIGGYVGLFLGYSVYQITDLTDMIITLLQRRTQP